MLRIGDVYLRPSVRWWSVRNPAELPGGHIGLWRPLAFVFCIRKPVILSSSYLGTDGHKPKLCLAAGSLNLAPSLPAATAYNRTDTAFTLLFCCQLKSFVAFFKENLGALLFDSPYSQEL